MKTLKFSNEQEWLEARLGKITGTRLKDIVVLRGSGKKKGYYELIAEKVALPADGEEPMARGKRLECEAVARFEKETKIKLDTSLVMWVREDNENIAISPDGFKGKKLAVECKCLNSAAHIEAYITKQIPNDYKFQNLQYFIVNDDLETLYWIFYDPRMPEKTQYFTFKVTREELKKDIEEYLKYEKDTLAEIESIINDLTF